VILGRRAAAATERSPVNAAVSQPSIANAGVAASLARHSERDPCPPYPRRVIVRCVSRLPLSHVASRAPDFVLHFSQRGDTRRKGATRWPFVVCQRRPRRYLANGRLSRRVPSTNGRADLTDRTHTPRYTADSNLKLVAGGSSRHRGGLLPWILALAIASRAQF
jgi:hypothetical protein